MNESLREMSAAQCKDFAEISASAEVGARGDRSAVNRTQDKVSLSQGQHLSEAHEDHPTVNT